jgi:hypothetical protein
VVATDSIDMFIAPVVRVSPILSFQPKTPGEVRIDIHVCSLLRCNVVSIDEVIDLCVLNLVADLNEKHGSWHGSDQAEWAGGIAGPNGLFRLLAGRFPVFRPCVALC